MAEGAGKIFGQQEEKTMIEINHKVQHGDPHAIFRFCPRCAARMERQPVQPEGKIHPVCPACGYILFLNPKVVACTLPTANGQDGQIILLRRAINPAYGRWTMPGGYVDLGESVQEAARRETHEEIRAEVELTTLLNLYSYPGVEAVVAVYLARIIRGEPQPGMEALEIGCFGPKTIPWDELAFPSTHDALKDWIARQAQH